MTIYKTKGKAYHITKLYLCEIAYVGGLAA
jgi:hypothetical protein